MNCTKCGTSNPYDAKFCRNCGEEIEEIVTKRTFMFDYKKTFLITSIAFILIINTIDYISITYHQKDITGWPRFTPFEFSDITTGSILAILAAWGVSYLLKKIFD